MNKKGSHVGMVISFLIFILLLLFIYTALQPAIKLQRDKQVILDGVKNKLTHYFDINLTTLIIETNKEDTGTVDCLSINLGELTTDYSEKHFFVRTIGGDSENFGVEGDQLKIEWDGSSGRLYKIYISEQNFTLELFSPTNCVSLTEIDYEIRTTQKDKYLGLEKITDFMNHFVENKTVNKEYFGVPKDSDFDVSISSDEINFPFSENNLATNIYSDEIPLQYVNTQARIIPFFMRVRVW